MRQKLIVYGIFGILMSWLQGYASVLCAQPPSILDSAAYYLKLAQMDKQQNRRLDLLHDLDKALAFPAQDPVVLRDLGKLLAEQHKYTQALELYKKAIQRNGADVDLLRLSIQLADQLHQPDDVIWFAEKLKQVDSRQSVAIYLGKVYYESSDYGKAIPYLKQAATYDPQSAIAPYLLAKSYADMMNFKGAIPYFLKALQLDPKQPNWLYELGLSYYAVRDDAHALQYIQQAAQAGYRQENDYLENLAIAYLNVGQFDQGVRLLKEALDRRPSDFNLLNMLAEAHYDQAKFTEAIDYWDRILAYDKENASALYMIGLSYQKMGGKQNGDKGVALCDKAISMDPSLAGLKQKKMMAGL